MLFGHWFVGIQALMTCGYVSYLQSVSSSCSVTSILNVSFVGSRPEESQLGKGHPNASQRLGRAGSSEALTGTSFFLSPNARKTSFQMNNQSKVWFEFQKVIYALNEDTEQFETVVFDTKK